MGIVSAKRPANISKKTVTAIAHNNKFNQTAIFQHESDGEVGTLSFF